MVIMDKAPNTVLWIQNFLIHSQMIAPPAVFEAVAVGVTYFQPEHTMPWLPILCKQLL